MTFHPLIAAIAEWEYAARGGLSENVYPWGNKPQKNRMNGWEGKFPGRKCPLVPFIDGV